MVLVVLGLDLLSLYFVTTILSKQNLVFSEPSDLQFTAENSDKNSQCPSMRIKFVKVFITKEAYIVSHPPFHN